MFSGTVKIKEVAVCQLSQPISVHPWQELWEMGTSFSPREFEGTSLSFLESSTTFSPFNPQILLYPKSKGSLSESQASILVVLKVGSLDQQHQHHVETCLT